jgi:hypothetical protein
MAVYDQQLLLTMEGGQDQFKWHKEFISQFAPHGVVDAAFKTDEESTQGI